MLQHPQAPRRLYIARRDASFNKSGMAPRNTRDCAKPPNLRDDSCSLQLVDCSLNSVNATSKPSSYVTRIREGVLREEVERPLRERGLPRFHQ